MRQKEERTVEAADALKGHVAHGPENRRPFQGRVAWWRRHPVAALHLPPATSEQAFSLRPQPPFLSRTQYPPRHAYPPDGMLRTGPV